ncbi:thiamine/thiamine pyrophosphate ABC transporter permease [Halomonas binhaiensis]|uniref:Thiamine transport system permease protein ThiP n=1 Tax=Halomonas binhaiensis TaxID=2562282 RepID=A0A5C1NEG3_9GAMM|nr:thiamine/thiamine pyrophosphate ABC transporter permease [Halomonas binhaiensis]QEM80858.1 thiamine/thiamine pyrophosphate ABC transporter permease [Halomonas binhaiensis]
MAQRFQPLSGPATNRLPLPAAGLVMLGIVAVGLGSLAALIHAASDLHIAQLWQEPYLLAILKFSLWQATLSTLISLGLGMLVAVVLARRPRFPGRGLLLRIMEMSLVIPSLLALFGLVAVHGRQGWVAPLIEAMPFFSGNAPGYLYGLSGIVLAHVFFNLPLSARIMLQAVERAPGTHWRLVAQFGLSRRAIWQVLEWPAIKPLLPRLAALVFTLCFTSFAIVMTLGGGPGSSTLEVALYQALKYDNDLALAALLALTQLTICLALWGMALAGGASAPLLQGGSEQRVGQPLDAQRRDTRGWRRLGDGVTLSALILLLVPPLVAIVIAGLAGVPQMVADGTVWAAARRSLLMASCAGIGAVSLALVLLAGTGVLRDAGRRGLAAVMEGSGQLILVLPALVLGTGLFVLLRPALGGAMQAYALVVLVNALMALPFAMQVLRSGAVELAAPQRRLADQLGIHGWARLRWLLWPRLRRPMALSLAYAMTLSLGDFSVIALFGSPASPTLPMLLYQQLGGYRWQSAAATALMLLALIVLIFALLSVLTRRLPRYPWKRSGRLSVVSRPQC